MTLRTLKKHKGFTSGVAWSPDGTTLAVSGGTSGFVTFWDPVQAKQLRTVEHGNMVNGMAWSPDSKLVACGTDQGLLFGKRPTAAMPARSGLPATRSPTSVGRTTASCSWSAP